MRILFRELRERAIALVDVIPSLSLRISENWITHFTALPMGTR